jgi:hypothetical protein
MLSKDSSPVFLVALTMFGLLFPAITAPRATRSVPSTEFATSGGSAGTDSTRSNSPDSPSNSGETCPGALPVVSSCTDAWQATLKDFFFPVGPEPTSGTSEASRAAQLASATFAPVAKHTDRLPVTQVQPGTAPPELELQTATFEPAAPTCRPFLKLPPLRFLIATVADPAATGLRASYDQALEAVGTAVESFGYRRDRYWNPWDAYAPGMRKRIGSAQPSESCAEQLPGLLLYRPDPKAPPDRPESHPLAVLVIGESPTWGIHKRAFTTALDLVAFEQGGPHAAIRILGPSYSGSAESLKKAIQRWRQTTPEASFDIVTGSATSPLNSEVYFRPESNLSFRQATIPDDVLQQAFYRYLHERWGVPSQCVGFSCVLEHVAVFSESGTEYGRSFQQASQAEHWPVYAPEWPIQFNLLHISSVRASYEASSKGSPPAAPTAFVGPTTLDPRMDNAARTDTLPLLSRSTPASDDLVLSRLIASISDRGIQFVGIAGTDSADVVFLAQHVRQHRPDIRLFVFDGDIMYTHPDFLSATGGMLMVTPYPVTPALQSWSIPYLTDPKGADLGQVPEVQTFATPAGMGTYRAARMLLEGTDPRKRKADDADTSRLAVWISAVGLDGAWPLAVIAEPERYGRGEPLAAQSDGRSHSLREAPPPSSWTAFAVGVLTLCAWVLVGLCLALRAPKRLPKLFRPFQAISIDGSSSLSKACLIGLAIGSAVAIALPVTWLTSIQAPVTFHRAALMHILVGGLSLLVLGASMIALVTLLSRIGRRPPSGAALIILLWLAPLALVLFFDWELLRPTGPGVVGRLFALRAVAIGNRLSPVLPLMLSIGLLYLMAVVHVQRLWIRGRWSLASADHPLPPDWPADAPWQVGPVRQLGADLSAWMRQILPAGVATAVALAVALEVRPISSLEGKAINALFHVLFIASGVVVVTSFVWLLSVWSSLGGYLTRLGREYDPNALQAAMRRLPDGLAASSATRLAGLPSEAEQARSLMKLATWLHSNRQSMADWLAMNCPTTSRARFEGAFDRSFGALQALGKEPSDKEFFDATFRVRTGLLPLLQELWNEPTHRRPAPAKQTDEEAPDKGDADAATWLARLEELVAGHAAICIHPVVSQLRLFLALGVGGALLWALAIGSYTFEPARLLMTIVAVCLIAILLTAFALFVSLERNELLSALSKTEAKITWTTFLSDALMWIVLPFLAFLSVQYPAAANSVASWLAPAGRLLQ